MEAKVVGYEVDLGSLRATELRLGLPGTQDEPQKAASRGSKRTLQAGAEEESSSRPSSDCSAASGVVEHSPEPAPPAKAQVVGWPPIRSYRKNCLQARKTGAEAPPGLYVKVSMDGAPYLRKMDLRSYSGYKELREAMETMFKCFSSTEGSCTSSEYVITYEDKDGDWMLAGDVPWEMFTSSCKRMRIMRGSEARGLGSAS